MTELLETHLKKIEREKEKKRIELLRKISDALNKLSEEITFREAYIFGSVLKPRKFYYDSDIDIAVSGLANKDFFLFMSRLADLLGRDIDVLQIEKHRLKDKIIKEGLLWKRQN